MTLAGAPLRVPSRSAVDTRELAGRLSALLVAGDIVLLGGDLGAGKTTFTQGLAIGLGVSEPVTSPTFILLRSYDGRSSDGKDRLKLLHADVYRLDHLQEIIDLGLPELMEDGGVAVIEWGDMALPVLLPDYLNIRIEFGAGDDDRELVLQPVGRPWMARHRRMCELLGPTNGPTNGPPNGRGVGGVM